MRIKPRNRVGHIPHDLVLALSDPFGERIIEAQRTIKKFRHVRQASIQGLEIRIMFKAALDEPVHIPARGDKGDEAMDVSAVRPGRSLPLPPFFRGEGDKEGVPYDLEGGKGVFGPDRGGPDLIFRDRTRFGLDEL
jgi:hypothetical protein